MIKLATAKILIPELIRDELNVFKLMQVHENKEDQDVSLEKEDKLSL